MNKYSKIGLTALAGSLVAGSVSAAELSASGSAAIYFSGGDDNKITGNGWSMADSVTFCFRRRKYLSNIKHRLDGDAASAKTNSGATYSSTTSMNVVDSHSIKFDLVMLVH